MTGWLKHFSEVEYLQPACLANSLKLSQVGWGLLVDNHFQVSPEMFSRVQVRALTVMGLLKNTATA